MESGGPEEREKKSAQRNEQSIWEYLLKVGRVRNRSFFFYGVDSGVVGRKVADVAQTYRSGTNTSKCGYNKVLVDAECTHDGSLKHITKYEQWGWETFEKRFLNEERIASITSLQLSLLSNGFRLLDPGGTLIYSTCSFTKDQNEGVVERFLATHGDAELQEVEAARQWPCKAGGLPHTLRFDPVASNTSGLFLAKVKKLGLEPPSKHDDEAK
jgi:16S rRNA C967 or C1407 C5-methylase (RsmB/RsmF family)